MQGSFPQAFPVSLQVYVTKGAPSDGGPRAFQAAKMESPPDLNGSGAANASGGDRPFASYLGDQVRSLACIPKSPANAESHAQNMEMVGNPFGLHSSFHRLKGLIHSLLTQHLIGDASETIARTVEGDTLPCSLDNSIADCGDDLAGLSALASLLPSNCKLREMLENADAGNIPDLLPVVQRFQGAFRELAMLYRRLMTNGETEIRNPGAAGGVGAGAQGNGEHSGPANLLNGWHFAPGSSERFGRGAIDSYWHMASDGAPADSLRQVSQAAESLVRELKQALGEPDSRPMTLPYPQVQSLDQLLRGLENPQIAVPLDFAQTNPTDSRLDIIRQTQNAMHDMLDRMRGTVVLDPGAKDAIVRLDPPALGRLQIQMQVDDSQRVVALIRSNSPETQAFLDQNKEELRRGLRDQGFDMEQSDIRIGAMDDEMFWAEISGSIYRRT